MFFFVVGTLRGGGGEATPITTKSNKQKNYIISKKITITSWNTRKIYRKKLHVMFSASQYQSTEKGCKKCVLIIWEYYIFKFKFDWHFSSVKNWALYLCLNHESNFVTAKIQNFTIFQCFLCHKRKIFYGSTIR